MRNENLKCWKDLTDCEKGALLLAKHEGKEIEVFFGGEWIDEPSDVFEDYGLYRVKPEPTLYVKSAGSLISTHKITYKTEDGEPILDSIKMEKL